VSETSFWNPKFVTIISIYPVISYLIQVPVYKLCFRKYWAVRVFFIWMFVFFLFMFVRLID
jgi:hypothetical protein